MIINIDKTVVDFSDLNDYQIFSNGYHWMSYEATISINNITNSKSVEEALNDPILWDLIGRELFGMMYIENNGEYEFIIPVYSDSSEADVSTKEKIGDVISSLTKKSEFDIFFSNKTKFILYNNRIAVEHISDKDDANIINIVYNLISLFLLQILRKGQ